MILMIKAVFSPKARAMGATIVFSLAGICGLVFFMEDIYASLPLAIFYATITVNTFFSIRLFSNLIPAGNISQKVIDAVLFVSYLALAFSFNSPIIFASIVTLLFIAATLKYALLLKIINHPKLLKRKIAIDSLGVVMGALSMLAIAMGYTAVGAWFLATVFLAANIFLLFIRPMYRV